MYKLLLLFLFLVNTLFFSQSNWTNGGGNAQRNGIGGSNPLSNIMIWQGTSSGLFGTQCFTEGTRVATMRFTSMTYAPVVCQSLINGSVLWTKDITDNTGRSLPIGFRDGKVYVVRFTESNTDSIYALDANTGNIIWKSSATGRFGITSSSVFASNGDLILETYLKIHRINQLTGDTVWGTTYIPNVLGNGEPVIYGNTIYAMEAFAGGIRLVAFNITNGARKYTVTIPDTHPGGPYQQAAPMAGPNGIIYAHKQGDNITAVQDNGSSLNILWTTEIFGSAPFSYMGFSQNRILAPDNGRIIALDANTGAIVDSTPVIGNPSLFQLRVAVGFFGYVYASDGQNGVHFYNASLNEIAFESIPGINTSGPALCNDNGLVVAGSGTTMKFYSTLIPKTNNETENAVLFNLEQNYPNPFNPETNIIFHINKRSFVQLEVYNIKGQLVKVLEERICDKGEYNVKFSAENLPSGIYLYYLKQDGKEIITRRMILIK